MAGVVGRGPEELRATTLGRGSGRNYPRSGIDGRGSRGSRVRRVARNYPRSGIGERATTLGRGSTVGDRSGRLMAGVVGRGPEELRATTLGRGSGRSRSPSPGRTFSRWWAGTTSSRRSPPDTRPQGGSTHKSTGARRRNERSSDPQPMAGGRFASQRRPRTQRTREPRQANARPGCWPAPHATSASRRTGGRPAHAVAVSV